MGMENNKKQDPSVLTGLGWIGVMVNGIIVRIGLYSCPFMHTLPSY